MRAKVRSIELGGVVNLAVLAPIKGGFVPGFETITYLERLKRLLDALQAARQNLRESELRKPVFPDSVGRLGIIHNFRYAIVPPEPPLAGARQLGTSRLSLNVSFDGGWEPYMRVIYRDIGTLLDALFCHCVGYPGSIKSDYDVYCRWVRDHELDAGLFYTDASPSLGDYPYLAEVERLQRETPDREDADRAIAQFALDSDRQQVGRAFRAVWELVEAEARKRWEVRNVLTHSAALVRAVEALRTAHRAPEPVVLPPTPPPPSVARRRLVRPAE